MKSLKLIIIITITCFLSSCASNTFTDGKYDNVSRIVIRDTSGQLYSITTGLLLNNDGNAYIHKLEK